MKMEYLSLVNTSLDLNTNPLVLVQNNQNKKELVTNFTELGRTISVEDETKALVEELSRLNAENKKLTEMLKVLCENYNSLRNQLKDYTSENQVIFKKRRVLDNNSFGNDSNINNDANCNNNGRNSDQSSSEEYCCNTKRTNVELEHVNAKISTISVRTETSDASLIIKDGYQWKKYGQKVTRDNPCPRAYFKCSFAPSCPVKKKVQRSIEDQSIVVATYEGEHNHQNPSKAAEPTASSPSHSLTLGLTHKSPSLGLSSTLGLNLARPIKPKNNTNIQSSSSIATNTHEFHQFLVEKMASTLTKDTGFKAALAAAVTGKFLQQ